MSNDNCSAYLRIVFGYKTHDQRIYLTPITDDEFRKKSTPCLLRKAPKDCIPVDCELSEKEKAFKEDHRAITYIPGGLADECDHILVFTSQARLENFSNQFCDLYPSAVFACGGTKEEFKLSKTSMQNGTPVFAFKEHGFVPYVFEKKFLDKGKTKSETAVEEMRRQLDSLDSHPNNEIDVKVNELAYESELKKLAVSVI